MSEKRLGGCRPFRSELPIFSVVAQSFIRFCLNEALEWGTLPQIYQTQDSTSAFLLRLFVFVCIEIKSRKMSCARVTRHPTAEWVTNVVRVHLWESETVPDLVVCDREPAFDSSEFERLLRNFGSKRILIPPRSPKANAFTERLNRSIQEECTDQFLFFGEDQLQQALSQYRNYYNRSRCHQGIEQRTPVRWDDLTFGMAREGIGDLVKSEVLGGLHHEYSMAG